MLDDAPPIAFVTVTEAAHARHFHRDRLGLALAGESPFAVKFDRAGTMLRATLADHAAPAAQTVPGWRVADIGATVAAIAKAGIGNEPSRSLGQGRHGAGRRRAGRSSPGSAIATASCCR
jgi:hypothetical protein